MPTHIGAPIGPNSCDRTMRELQASNVMWHFFGGEAWPEMDTHTCQNEIKCPHSLPFTPSPHTQTCPCFGSNAIPKHGNRRMNVNITSATSAPLGVRAPMLQRAIWFGAMLLMSHPMVIRISTDPMTDPSICAMKYRRHRKDEV